MVNSRLDEIVAEYLRQQDAGMEPLPSVWIERYPEFTSELTDFFDELSRISDLAAPLRTLMDEDTGLAGAPSLDGFRVILQQVGDKRLSDYEILEEIGRGGMGLVLRAHQHSLRRDVALKIVTADPTLSPEAHRRFRVEVESVAMLDHPHIVPIFECGTAGPYRYFSMKLIRGEALSERIDSYRSKPREAARLIQVLADAVHYAHQRGILHRDLKPGNILVDENEVPYVTDFGLAVRMRHDERATIPGLAAGTLCYMAPEQVSGAAEVTTTADVYALGVVLYQLLTGDVPFSDVNQLRLIESIEHQTPIPPDRISAETGSDLATICLKCLEKDPDDRYPSANALAEDLNRWLSGKPISARRSTLLYRLRKWVSREPYTALCAAAAVMAMLFGVTGVVWKWRDAERHRAEAEHAEREALSAKSRTETALRHAEMAAETARIAENEAVAARNEQILLKRELKRQVFVKQMTLAGHALPRGDFALMREQLDECPRRSRNWAWNYLQRRLAGFLPQRLARHDMAVTTCAAGRDGDLVATGSRAGTVILQRSSDPAWSSRWQVDTKVVALDLHPDGDSLAVGTTGGTVHILSVPALQPLRVLTAHKTAIAAVRFSPDGQCLATCGGSQNTLHSGELAVWNMGTGEFDQKDFTLPRRICGLKFSPDSKTLVTAGEDGYVRFWSLESNTQIRTMQVSESPLHGFDVDWNNGKLAAACRSETVLWDLQNNCEIQTSGRSGRAIAFSPDGERLFLGGTDKSGDIAVLLTENLEPVLTLDGKGSRISNIVPSSDGNRLLSAGDDRYATVWNASPVSREEAPLWILRQEKFSSRRKSESGISPETEPRLLTICRAANRIATVHQQSNIFVWNTDAQKLSQRLETDSNIVGICLSPNTDRLAFVNRRNDVFIWNLSSNDSRLQRLAPSDNIRNAFNRGISFHPSSNHLVTQGGMFATSWSLKEAKPSWQIKDVFYNHAGAVISPDGLFIASGGVDQVVRLRKADTGECAAELQGHAGTVLNLVFSPDSRRLVSGGASGRLIVWDHTSGAQITTLSGHVSPLRDLIFDRKGARIATFGEDHSIRLWDAETGECSTCIPVADLQIKALYDLEGDKLTAIGARRGSLVWIEISVERAGW